MSPISESGLRYDRYAATNSNQAFLPNYDISCLVFAFDLHFDFCRIYLQKSDSKFCLFETGNYHNNDFFGGNIKGIEEKLEYLKSLNVGVIYMSPISER